MPETGRAGPSRFIMDIDCMVGKKHFFRLNFCKKFIGFPDFVLLEIPYMTVERNSRHQARSISSALLRVACNYGDFKNISGCYKKISVTNFTFPMRCCSIQSVSFPTGRLFPSMCEDMSFFFIFKLFEILKKIEKSDFSFILVS